MGGCNNLHHLQPAVRLGKGSSEFDSEKLNSLPTGFCQSERAPAKYIYYTTLVIFQFSFPRFPAERSDKRRFKSIDRSFYKLLMLLLHLILYYTKLSPRLKDTNLNDNWVSLKCRVIRLSSLFRYFESSS